VDSGTAARRVDDLGVTSVQFVLASVLALVLFLALANLIVVQYGRGALRSALEQGARSGSLSGVTACETTARVVIEDLLGGRMSDQLVVSCSSMGATITASGSAVFESWTPLTSDFVISLTSTAVAEP
jgi:hypothetical protein